MDCYILRTKILKEDGTLMVDSFHLKDTLEELVDFTYKVNSNNYECYMAEDITNEVFMSVQGLDEKKELEKIVLDKEHRRQLWLELTREFEHEGD